MKGPFFRTLSALVLSRNQSYGVQMLGRSYEGQDCSIARTLEVVGERWSLLIVRDAGLRRITRFADFQRSLGIAKNVLATRLDRLVDEGILERRPYEAGTRRNDYVLTDKGRDLVPLVLALAAWGDRWLAPDGPPVRFEHSGCGGEVAPRLSCARCGEDVEDHEVTGIRQVPASN
jgi:DNA-binding HxlR family transcriptional regulator